MPTRAYNSSFPEKLHFNGADYHGPTELFHSVKPPPKVALDSFRSRLRKWNQSGWLDEAVIYDSLYLTVKEYQQKYRGRKTWVDVGYSQIDLLEYFQNNSTRAAVSYRIFWQRLKRLIKSYAVDESLLEDALTFSSSDWISFYGGGRHRSFYYGGDLFPDYFGKKFHGFSAFLKTVGRYADKDVVWSRLKAGWDIDSALSIPVDVGTERTGRIYKITRLKTGQIYVGLTRSTIEQRWSFHVRNALNGAKTKLSKTIRKDSPSGFSIETIEDDIRESITLGEREIYWVNKLNTLGPQGLNMAKPGNLGGAKGVQFEWEGRTFSSITEAAYVLGQERNLPSYVVESRLRSGEPLPTKSRKHSKHPDAGSNLFRRWLALKKRYPSEVDPEWSDSFDAFKADVSPSLRQELRLTRIDNSKPWGPGNWKWVTPTKMVEATHGKSIFVKETEFPSLQAVAKAFGIGYSVLKDRINRQGLTPEQAVSEPLAATSRKKIEVEGKIFRSKRQAILYISEKYNLTEGQAKYRLEKGDFGSLV